jgi:hypothetical protein
MSKTTQATSEEAQAAKSYRVTRPEGHEGPFGISYPDPEGDGEKYAKEGKVVSDLPHGAIHGLLAEGAIELVEPKDKASKAGDD